MIFDKPLPDYSFAEPYVPPHDMMETVICDIDGTLMHMGERHFTEYDKVHLDTPDMRVVKLLHILNGADDEGALILFVSGRPEKCREATEASIEKQGFTDYELFMRPDFRPNGKPDYRPDYEVKYEIFNRDIRHNYNVVACIDDRLQVVHLWRAMGLLCLDVAGGDF